MADMSLEQFEHHTVTVNGLRMHYAAAGEGPLCILLHGFPECWWSFRYQLNGLGQRGFRVVAPDMRGYNETEKSGPYDTETLARDIASLIEVLGETSAFVVGHDWGGVVAWHLAMLHPNKVRRLSILNCPHPTMMAKALRSNRTQQRRSWYMFFFLLPWLPERVLTHNGAKTVSRAITRLAVHRQHLSDEETAPYRASALKPGAASAMLGYYRARVTGILRGGKKRPRASSLVEAPTLLIWGLQDSALLYDQLVPGTHKYVPRLRIQTLADVGHFPQEEVPERVTELLEQHFSVSDEALEAQVAIESQMKSGITPDESMAS